MNEHILLAYKFDKNGGGTPLEGDAISQEVKDKNLAWVHFDVNDPETRKWLKAELSYLDSFVVEALTADETRPRIIEINDGVMLILRGANLNADAEPEDMVSIRLWIDSHRIISVQRRQLKAVLDIETKLQKGKGPKNSGEFIGMLLSQLFKRMEPVLTTLDDLTDSVEEQIIESPDAALREHIVDIRKQAIMFRRYMSPQRDVINQLRMSNMVWLEEKQKRYLQEAYNHITRYIEDLDTIRERAQIVKDELANILADRLNKNMYVLSVIAAIFLPLGFLTGLLGINVGGIPGEGNSSAFTIFCGILTVVVVLQIIIFKKMRWF